jgi:hypothetical protein
MLGLLREAMPGLASRLEEVSKVDPEGGRRMLARWAPRLREAAQLKKNDPELFGLRMAEMREGWGVIEASRGARELSKGSHDGEEGIAAQRADAKGKLREALSKQFDARLAMQSHEVRALSKRLDELKAHLDEQQASRESRISEIADKILQDKDLPLEPGPGGRGPEDRPPPREGP